MKSGKILMVRSKKKKEEEDDGFLQTLLARGKSFLSPAMSVDCFLAHSHFYSCKHGQ